MAETVTTPEKRHYWIMGANLYRVPASKLSKDAELICEFKTVEQAHAVKKEIEYAQGI